VDAEARVRLAVIPGRAGLQARLLDTHLQLTQDRAGAVFFISQGITL
jgi:hypothetical protein